VSKECGPSVLTMQKYDKFMTRANKWRVFFR
jgi:hypothetical protein